MVTGMVYASHSKNCIHTSQPRCSKTKTITVVEYASENSYIKEPHTVLTKALQTRIKQLAKPVESASIENKDIIKASVKSSGITSKKSKLPSAIKPNKSTSLKQKSSVNKTAKSETSKKKTPPAKKATKETSLPQKKSQENAKTKKKADVTKPTKKGGNSTSKVSKAALISTKKKPAKSKSKTDKSAKENSSKSSAAKVEKEIQNVTEPKLAGTNTISPSSGLLSPSKSEVLNSISEQSQSRASVQTISSSRSSAVPLLSLGSSSVSSVTSVPVSSSPSSSLTSAVSSSSSPASSSSASSVISNSSLLSSQPSTSPEESSRQVQNLEIAFGSIFPSEDSANLREHTSTLGRTQSNNANPLHQKFADNQYVVEEDSQLPSIATSVSRTHYDFDHEDVFEHEIQSLETLSDTDPKVLASLEKEGVGNKLKSDTRKGGSGKWKRSTKKQFTENPELYLRPFMDAAVFIDSIGNAQSMMYAFEKINSGVDVEFYNTLIEAWARKGKWDEVRHLLARMVSKEVVSNLQTFAASLECLARCPDPDLQVVSKGLQQMEKESITLDQVLSKGRFSGEGRHLVINLVQRVLPDYQPPPPSERSLCTNKIVSDLYNSQSKELSSNGQSFSRLVTDQDRERRIGQQWAMEMAETVSVTSIEETGNPDAVTVHRRQLLDQHRAYWRISLKRALENEKTRQYYKFKNPNFGSICQYPFLSLLQPDEYASLMLQSLSSIASTTEGSMTIALARDLSNRLFRKFSIRSKLQQGNAEQVRELYSTYVRETLGDKEEDFRLPRESFQQLEEDMLGSSSLDQSFQAKPWPLGIHIGIGTLLADIMLREIKIDANMHNNKPEKRWIPALYHMYTYRSFKHVGFIKPHPTLVDLFQTARDPTLEFDSNLVPMVTPPLPWTSVSSGAYPLSSTKIMRSKDGVHQHQTLLEKTSPGNLYPILDALNQLSTVPWIINKPVLDTVISVFRFGGSKDLDVPQPASACPQPPRITSEVSREELAQIHRERAAARKLQAEMHSLRMDMLYKLSIADKFRDEIFWFPHNMDFRGRVYPCPPHFNHFGSDVTRSILLFAEGRPLGEEGLRWLKIHLVNLTGHKKRFSVDERLAYAHEMMPEIYDSADNPLDGNKWWQEADEPWQTLACCVEVTKAMRSGDPTQYVSHLPIHQDGSCNGLQHYAALGRDLIGAQQVNLHPYDVPQDVYSGVAQMVEEMRAKDAEKGNQIAQALEGHVKRNVVKQTVMTVVYGVTSYGGRRQILKQLRGEDDLSVDQKWFAAGYLTLKVFQSLRKMFTKTREIQDWLTESAWLISKAGETVEWVTPLGLPIIQPYHKKSLKLISHDWLTESAWLISKAGETVEWVTPLGLPIIQPYHKKSLKLISHGGRNVYHEERHSQTERPDTMKQKNAFPPNFIHSLDSTHMMLTSLYSQRAGITFASVHDCYWTHANSVNLMNKICRNQFVKLHKEPILDNLATFMIDKYGPLDIKDTSKLKRGNRDMKLIEDYVKSVPEKGDFDLDNVLKSTYFFS